LFVTAVCLQVFMFEWYFAVLWSSSRNKSVKTIWLNTGVSSFYSENKELFGFKMADFEGVYS